MPKKLDIPFEKLIKIAKAINENTILNRTRTKENKISTDSFIRKFGINRKDFAATIKETSITYNPSTFLYEIPGNYLGNTKVTPADNSTSNTKVIPHSNKKNQNVSKGNTEVILKESNTSIAVRKEIVEAIKNAIDIRYPELEKMIEWFKKNQECNDIIDLPDININNPKLKGEVINKSFKTYKSVIDDFIKFSQNRKETQKDLLALALIEFMAKYKR